MTRIIQPKMSIYFEAANIIKQIDLKKSSIKSLIYGSKISSKKVLYALVCETLKYRKILEIILDKVQLLDKEKGLRKNRYLAMVLLYEHLLGKGVSGQYKACFSKFKSSIHSQCEILKIKNKVTDLRQLVTEHQGESLPKYVRVNTLKTTTDKVIQCFKDEGRRLLPCEKESFIASARKLSAENFLIDPHIPDLLVFEPMTDFHEHPLYKSGEIILQDKASCFPAYILSPTPGSHVIDCCAAPGNKTSHLASIMQNNGSMFAFDKNKTRLQTLKSLTSKAGASCIEAIHGDFLSVNPSEDKYKHVEYILVDPSCSGTGMVNRSTQYIDETNSSSKDRLYQLAKFQTSILQHALSFPSVKRVVYSTCSIHEEENEQVVEKVLSTCGDNFELFKIEPDWPIRGSEGYEHAQSCLRMSHDSSLTNGFFVARFERKREPDGTHGTGPELVTNQSHYKKKEALDSKSSIAYSEEEILDRAVSEKRKKKKKLKGDIDSNMDILEQSPIKKPKLNATRTANVSYRQGLNNKSKRTEDLPSSDYVVDGCLSSIHNIKNNKRNKKKPKKQITR